MMLAADSTQVKYATMTNCDLVSVGSEFSRKPLALAVQQNSPLKDQLSSAYVLPLCQFSNIPALTAVRSGIPIPEALRGRTFSASTFRLVKYVKVSHRCLASAQNSKVQNYWDQTGPSFFLFFFFRLDFKFSISRKQWILIFSLTEMALYSYRKSTAFLREQSKFELWENFN